MNLIQVLTAAKTKIQNPDNWVQKYFAIDAAGKPVSFARDDACKFCALGAVLSVSDCESAAVGKAYHLLSSTALELFGMNIVKVNDTLGHAAVLEVYNTTLRQLGEDVP